MGINHTLGGLVIDTTGRVYNGDNLPIFGLYAGGEVVGNAQGGDYYFGLMDAAIIGGVCGQNAVYYVMDHTGLTEPAAREAQNTEAAAVKGNFEDGEYTGVGTGMGGTIEVTVTVKDGSITDITVGDNAETAIVFAAVKSQFIPEMIRQQNLDLDACSGATFSCEGVREAVKNALGK